MATAITMGSLTQISHPSPIISLFEDDDTRWQAVKDRNANADGFFVYCVRTTKIYCRPICKARLARRANVSFHATGAEAQHAGFRACKRCRPELVGFMPEEDAVRKIRAFVGGAGADGSAGPAQSLSQMARLTGLSKWHFHRVFKRCVGVTPVEYLRMLRVAARPNNGASDGNQLQTALDITGMGSLDATMASGGSSREDSLPVSNQDNLFSIFLPVFNDGSTDCLKQ